MIGPPPLPSCWIASFQPIRVLAKKIDSIARDDSFLIGCVPAGGVIPKIFATIKLPIRACSSAAPPAISRGKCFFSVPSSNGFRGGYRAPRERPTGRALGRHPGRGDKGSIRQRPADVRRQVPGVSHRAEGRLWGKKSRSRREG